MKTNIKENFKISFITILLPGILYGVLGPLEIYSGNYGEFEFGFWDFFPIFLVLVLILSLLGAFVISLFPKKVNDIFILLIFMLGLLSYVQGLFLNRQLMQSDGNGMHWEEMKTLFAVNLVIWIVLFIAGVVLFISRKKIFLKAAYYIALFIEAVLVVTIISLLVTVPKERKDTYEYKLNGEQEFMVGADENILVLVLDSYGEEALNTELAESEELADALKDFTYYDNDNSVFFYTVPCLTYLFTGAEYDYEKYDEDKIDHSDWQELVWNNELDGAPDSHRLFDALHNADYQVHMYSYDVCSYSNSETVSSVFDNVELLEVGLNYRLLLALLTKMSIYKYVPYVLKPAFEVRSVSFQDVVYSIDNKDIVNNNGLYYQELKEDGLSVNPEISKLFSVTHLMGLHDPYTMDENANIVGDTSREQEEKALNYLLEEYLNQLKSIGSYDNSTIIIMADHGRGFTGLHPIFLIKRAGESQDAMVRNSAPISHEDFIPTIYSFIGADVSSQGTTIYDWQENDERERKLILENNYTILFHNSDELYEKFAISPGE